MFVEILCFVVCRYWSFGGVLFVFDLFTFFLFCGGFLCFFLYAFYIVYVSMCMLLPVLKLVLGFTPLF